jgi:hypothetical protein
VDCVSVQGQAGLDGMRGHAARLEAVAEGAARERDDALARGEAMLTDLRELHNRCEAFTCSLVLLLGPVAQC